MARRFSIGTHCGRCVKIIETIDFRTTIVVVAS